MRKFFLILISLSIVNLGFSNSSKNNCNCDCTKKVTKEEIEAIKKGNGPAKGAYKMDNGTSDAYYISPEEYEAEQERRAKAWDKYYKEQAEWQAEYDLERAKDWSKKQKQKREDNLEKWRESDSKMKHNASGYKIWKLMKVEREKLDPEYWAKANEEERKYFKEKFDDDDSGY